MRRTPDREADHGGLLMALATAGALMTGSGGCRVFASRARVSGLPEARKNRHLRVCRGRRFGRGDDAWAMDVVADLHSTPSRDEWLRGGIAVAWRVMSRCVLRHSQRMDEGLSASRPRDTSRLHHGAACCPCRTGGADKGLVGQASASDVSRSSGAFIIARTPCASLGHSVGSLSQCSSTPF